MKPQLILLPLLATLLLGVDKCETPPKPNDQFCAGSSMSVNKRHRKFNVSKAEAAILHGSPAQKQMAVLVEIPNSGYCSGLAVSKHVVLTAAHCGFNTEGHRIRDDFIANGGTLLGTAYAVAFPKEWYDWTANGNIRARETDLMLLYVEEELPAPEGGFIDLFQPLVDSGRCKRIIAQGFGQAETPIEVPCPDGQSRCLREAEVSIDAVDVSYYGDDGRLIKAGLRSEGKICFGDSGSLLLAEMNDGTYKYVAVTSTTASSDCEVHSHHVHVGSLFTSPEAPTHIKKWYLENVGRMP